MSSGLGGIGSTLTGGIQDVAALLPLLGTEQCEVQVSSALTKGYLYAAATPMSIFGSLGMVRAGFKTLVACFSFRHIEGAQILGNMGFEPKGENLSLIMVGTVEASSVGSQGKGKNDFKGRHRYLAETRIDNLIKELNVDKGRIAGISSRCVAWNVRMMCMTGFFCTLSIAPYILVNLGANNLSKSTTWVFPTLRATGGFLTATLMQVLIQRRIISLTQRYVTKLESGELVKMDKAPPLDEKEPRQTGDLEANIEGANHRSTEEDESDAQILLTRNDWMLLFLLFLGLIASVVGYVGSFSVVQNSKLKTGPVSWLCLEAGLSLLRMAIWGSNAKCDATPFLEFTLKLDEIVPLPTCGLYNEMIFENGYLPLTHAREFLASVISYAGLVDGFTFPDLSLYYTLTRKRVLKEDDDYMADSDEARANAQTTVGERVLYLTVFDHKERTTKVYTREENETDVFYSTFDSEPLFDLEGGYSNIAIWKVADKKIDKISQSKEIRHALRAHHSSILEQIRYRQGIGDEATDAIENGWTMKVEDSRGSIQRIRKDRNVEEWRKSVVKGREVERNRASLLDFHYLELGELHGYRCNLDKKLVMWNKWRRERIAEEAREFFYDPAIVYRKDLQRVETIEDTSTRIKELLISELFCAESLMLYEVEKWEELYWIKMEELFNLLGNDREQEKERLTREWRGYFRARLHSDNDEAEERLADLDDQRWGDDRHQLLGDWESVIAKFTKGAKSSFSVSSRTSEWIENSLMKKYERTDERKWIDNMLLRIKGDKQDIDFRVERGLKLGRFDQFWYDDTLFNCRYSQSKWCTLDREALIAPLTSIPLLSKQTKLSSPSHSKILLQTIRTG